ncbi:putative HVA22-like protein g [Macadamia integrifolia]|uniref:putative HVA22-like protein g n=1 Tax=Macadamia integrifolia TaxID=60698 RepID=UPI001C4F618B|nr:putative HVA22-like protein g [Macadamia integrifolia]XP_042513993.1 putative HVA22-like protein g [Macadamia integrifolia]XP_042513994.1 putative HVA22-like protein g [Macadamia integrifolia]
MLGVFITRGLVMLFGYAYPAFECYKTVEKNRIEIEQLRFWCQYWIIVAVLTVLERIVDVFVSWLPMYGELKLAFYIYLWYPKTKGTSYVYETFLLPYVAKHETHIDRKLLELRYKAWDLASYHLQNCASYGQNTFFQFLQYLASQTSKAKGPRSQNVDPQPPNSSPPPPPPRAMGRQPADEQTQQSSKKRTSTPPQSPISMKRTEFQWPKSDVVQEQQPSNIPPEATVVNTTISASSDDSTGPPASEEADMDETLRAARTRLRRSHSRPKE